MPPYTFAAAREFQKTAHFLRCLPLAKPARKPEKWGPMSGDLNLAAAIRELPHVLIFDNGDLSTPFRQVAVFEHGKLVTSNAPFPEWLQPLLG